MNDYIEFVGENCDSYIVNISDIVSFQVNGKDYRDFVKSRSKKILSYKLVTKNPIFKMKYDTNDFDEYYPNIYNWRDFCICYIFVDGRKKRYEIEWLGENTNYSYGQDIRRKNNLWIYSSDINIKPSYFKTYEIELLVKEMLCMHFNDMLTLEDIKNVIKLDIDITNLTEEHYYDLSLLVDLKELFFDCQHSDVDIKKIIRSNNNIEVLGLSCYKLRNKKILKQFPNLKVCYLDSEFNNKKILKNACIKWFENVENDKDLIGMKKNDILYNYNLAKENLNELCKMKLINNCEYNNYLNKINDIISKKVNNFNNDISMK